MKQAHGPKLINILTKTKIYKKTETQCIQKTEGKYFWNLRKTEIKNFTRITPVEISQSEMNVTVNTHIFYITISMKSTNFARR